MSAQKRLKALDVLLSLSKSEIDNLAASLRQLHEHQDALLQKRVALQDLADQVDYSEPVELQPYVTDFITAVSNQQIALSNQSHDLLLRIKELENEILVKFLELKKIQHAGIGLKWKIQNDQKQKHNETMNEIATLGYGRKKVLKKI